ncbi:hypothetical protein O7635_05260 [Asanoa sp. WMMD1127]|uniref:hypothetical protein n=1 Tax=Asanoa sp. WMMD1127 TaxID=3016107 RepID=UPI002417690E|nr:hypothetical protein [Asanoa sp. WMMD1127]MDG4821260.1 hypothetical protein [Asanoa sp. WMMD1127]
MLDHQPCDRVRIAFDELTDSVDPHVRPPGADSVLATVRRRRQRRLAGSTAAALAVVGVLALVRLPLADRPTVDQAEPARPAATTQGPLLPPFAPPTAVTPSPPAATVTVVPSDAPSEGGATRTAPPPPDRPTDDAVAPAAPCVSKVTAAATGGTLVFSAGPVCPGAGIVVSWATYETQQDGSQQLFASGRRTLTPDDPRWTATLRESPTCVGPWYALRADPPIPATIAADVVEPFPGGTVLAREDGEICLN